MLGGLFLIAIWLIEYDPDVQRTAATRLPVPVISSHAALALCGLAAWVGYLVTGAEMLAYVTLAILAGVVCLGVAMAFRWVKVYKSTKAPPRRATRAAAVPVSLPRVAARASVFDPSPAPQPEPDAQANPNQLVPPERHFPLAVVIGHGLFALATVTLVLLTVLGVGPN